MGQIEEQTQRKSPPQTRRAVPDGADQAGGDIRRAQPFPNPPPGLMGPNGTVTFPFGFYLETGGRPLMRIFRNN